MPDLNHRHLQYFRAVAHDGTLTAAASRLNLSQSALSSQIRTLEARLGHDLFERRGRSLVLTEAGRIALDHADSIADAAEELLSTLADTGRPLRQVRVGALATLSRNFQLGFLRPVLGRGGVEVVLRSGSTRDLMEGLETLSLDVVLTHAAPPDGGSRFIVHRLAEAPVGLFGRPEAVRAGTLAGLLAEAPLILPTGGAARAGFDRLVARLGVRPRLAAEVDDMAMMRLMAKAGAGLALVPPVVLKDEIESGALREAPFDLGISEAFHAVTIERRFPNPLLADLLDPFEAAA